MSTPRFSKASLLERLERRMDSMSEEAKRLGLRRGFDPGDGWDQVRGRGEELNRLYGAWNFIRELVQDLRS